MWPQGACVLPLLALQTVGGCPVFTLAFVCRVEGSLCPALAVVLGGSCSHTSCAAAKPAPPPHREAFLTFLPEKRGETSEFGGHHIIQIAI